MSGHHTVFLDGAAGIPIAATLREHPAGLRGRLPVVLRHAHHITAWQGQVCDVAVTEVQWMIRPDGTVGCTPGWLPNFFAGNLVGFTTVEEVDV